MKRKVLLGIFSGVFFLLISTPAVGAAEWGGLDVLTSLGGRWTSTELESKVPGAKARAIATENACTTKVNSLRASRLAAGDKSLMAQYTSNHNVFGSWYVWLSLKGSPLATEINVPSGSTDPVDLQLNYFWTSCSSVVRSRNNPGNLENHDFIQNHYH